MADGKEGGAFPSHEEMEYFRLYRERIVSEDALIYQRLSWLITAQTVMFSFTAIAFFRGGPGQIETHGTVIMCGLGIVMCLLGGAGVWAASQRIEEVRRQYQTKFPLPRPHPAMPDLIGRSLPHRIGRLVPLLVPPMFVVAWVAILVVALR